jgi:uncharacterized repeat protein (TIGR01451 family)
MKSAIATMLALLFCAAQLAAEGVRPGPSGDRHRAQHAVQDEPVFAHEAQLLGHGDPVAAVNTFFGEVVAISGDVAVVGARSDGPGAAYVFVRSGSAWSLQQRLEAPQGSSSFGSAVAIDGDTLVVGAGSQLDGAAHVFVRSGSIWTEQQVLVASDQVGTEAAFAFSVAIAGDTIVCGAPFAHFPDPGSGYVFVRSGTTWTEQQKLRGSDAAVSALVGWSVTISGETIVLGAPSDSTPAAPQAGSAFVFVRSGSTWSEQQKLFAQDGAMLDEFGVLVSASADTVAAGAANSAHVYARSAGVWTEEQEVPGAGSAVSVAGSTLLVSGADTGDGGSVSVFVRSGSQWVLQQKLSVGGDLTTRFGYSASLSGDTALIGQLGTSGNGTSLSSAYVFVRNGTTWSEQQQLGAPDHGFGDSFGQSVVVSGDTAVVGAPYDNTAAGSSAGSVSVYGRTGAAWSEQQKLSLPGEGLGTAVSLDGDTLAVLSSSGEVTLYVRVNSAWSVQQVLDATPPEQFASIALSGDTLAAGAPGDAVTSGGAAAVFVRLGGIWALQQRLTPSDPVAFSRFGAAVSLLGDRLVIGRPQDSFGPPGTNVGGSAYLFERSGTIWAQRQVLTASDAALQAAFGSSLAQDGASLAVGAPKSDQEDGAAYIFVDTGASFSQQQKLAASDATGSQFGTSVALSGDTFVAGAPRNNGIGTGAAYVFRRAGAVWTQQPQLQSPGVDVESQFGTSVSISQGTIAIGAPFNLYTGSVDIFRGISTTDVGVLVDDGQGSAVPGLPVTYTLSITDAGPDPGLDVRVIDAPPVELTDVSWTCSASLGSTCAAAGTGVIDQTVNVAVNGNLTYSLTGTVPPGTTGTLTNAATVTPLVGVVDGDLSNNSSTDVDALTPETDLRVTLSDGQTVASPGQPVTYTIQVENAGPSVASGALVSDLVGTTLEGVTWTCTPSQGSTCTTAGGGDLINNVTAPVGGMFTFTLGGTVNPALTGALVNTATVAPGAGASDPTMTNNFDTDVDALPVAFPTAGELVHGYDQQHSLAALPGPVAKQDIFRLFQAPHASYEILVDGISADLGLQGPLVERLAPDALTVLQTSDPAGAGGSRSLRWMNATDDPVVDEFVSVESSGCNTNCDAADVYQIHARETTGFVSRFNNSATQVSVLLLQNQGADPMDVAVRMLGPSGEALGAATALLPGHQTYILNTSLLAPASSGSISVANTGRYGQLVGKAAAIEPGTGFTFDTPLTLRPR